MASKGYRTSEFWLSAVATLLGFAYASGLLDSAPPLVAQIVALCAAALGAVGYTVSRTIVKASNNKLQAFLSQDARSSGDTLPNP